MVGYVFDALSKVYLRSIGYTNKMIYVSAVGMTIVLFNFVLNIILLPRYGYVAGAYVTVMSFFLLFVLSWGVAKFILKQPTTPLKIFWRPSLIFFCAILVYSMIIALDINWLFSILFRCALFFAFVIALSMAGSQKSAE
jgi:O-antigen/teichoic acid export membrane protein